MIYRAIAFVAYLKMKSLKAFRERQWNVIQVIVSDVKMLQFMQILEDWRKKARGKWQTFFKISSK